MIGGPLASRLGMELIDLDASIVAVAQRSIPEIFEADGERGFRDLETAALRLALAAEQPSVLACGGGIVTVAENLDLLREAAVTVYLTAELTVLSARLATSPTRRPLLDGDLGDRLAALASAREPLYRQAAQVVVDVDAPIAVVVDRIIEELAVHDASLTT